MNREIKFRGKTLYDHYDHYASPEPDTKEGTWVYGDLMTEYLYHKGLTIVENGVYHEVDPETVGQYVGLKDKNGVKIFEGDIIFVRGEVELACGDCCAWNHNTVVKWDANGCKYFLDVIDKQEIQISEYGFYHYDTFVLREWAEDEWWFAYRVEGNIHDNPELLEVLGDD